MARKQATLSCRKRARRVRRTKAQRQQEKRKFAAQLMVIARETEQFLVELAQEERVEQEEQMALEATYRKRQLVAEFGLERAEEIDWGERAFQSDCEAMLPES